MVPARIADRPNLGAAPCVIDIEASGFGRHSYPIEIGLALADGRGLCTLVQPADDWTHWDASAEHLHGIRREVARQHGRPVAEVADLLNRELDGQTVYSDAWAYDYSWLSLLFDTACRSQRFKLEHLRVLLTDAQADRLAEGKAMARAHLHVARHRASADARTLQWAVQWLLGRDDGPA